MNVFANGAAFKEFPLPARLPLSALTLDHQSGGAFTVAQFTSGDTWMIYRRVQPQDYTLPLRKRRAQKSKSIELPHTI